MQPDVDFQAAVVAALQPLANSQNVVLTVSYVPATPAAETVTVSPVAA